MYIRSSTDHAVMLLILVLLILVSKEFGAAYEWYRCSCTRPAVVGILAIHACPCNGG